MNDFLPEINAYCEAHTSPQSSTLYQLERETHLVTLAPQMLSGHLQGQLLALISKLMRPRAILEIGTFTGYASICLAQGLSEDGVLHTIEANAELKGIIEKYIRRAGLEEKIQLHIGDARTIIPDLGLKYGLVFIDAGKQDYTHYFDLVIDNVVPGGLLIADNVLWSGKVLGPERESDADAASIHQFNEKVQQDERVENIMLPIRDGLSIIRKLP